MHQIEELVPPVRALLEQAERESDRGELELELRLGTLGGRGSFVPGVSRDFMDTAIARLQTNPDCTASEWAEHEDYFYSLDVDGKKEQVRTRVSFDPFEMKVGREHTIKKRLGVATGQSGNLALRVVLSREVRVDEKSIPVSVETDIVRIQQRKKVSWSRDGKQGNAPWHYEFSITCSGATKSEAEGLRAKECVYELEIELDLASSYAVGHGADYLARSILLKAADFEDLGQTRSNQML